MERIQIVCGKTRKPQVLYTIHECTFSIMGIGTRLAGQYLNAPRKVVLWKRSGLFYYWVKRSTFKKWRKFLYHLISYKFVERHLGHGGTLVTNDEAEHLSVYQGRLCTLYILTYLLTFSMEQSRS